ncbi:DDX58 [Mytilus coruscus]|uniref:DDX58 n=1 Tax=Mytilus coruscus TaxID=42192 RepID=A0A6J8EDQ0_MYTCO|nr:DDX58 [Mytilus coruscus]
MSQELSAYDSVVSEKDGDNSSSREAQAAVVVFREPFEDKVCFEGETVSLECIIEGGMKPWPCKWYKGDKIVSSDNIRDESKDQTYKLTILNATNEDEGVYTLMIRNEKKDVQLKVIERQEGCVHLRNYQLELATIALRGENTIICAESGAGKTIVSYHVIERHLLNNPRGKVVFISRTNILQEQQYERACDTFSTPHFQGTINIWKAEDDDSDDFKMEIQKANLIFSTPKSLCNHLMDATAVHVSIRTFTLIILDECHHAYGKSVYNELMSYYRMAKYGEEMDCLPQIVGLTSSPGINKVKDLTSAKGHLKQIMANLDVSKLSIVKRYKEELLRYTSIAAKVILVYKIRQHEPVKHILLQAMAYVESKMNSRIDVFAEIREIGRKIEGENDIQAIIEIIESEYQRLEEDSGFIICVMTRAAAKAVAERLPGYLRCTNLTGLHKSVEEGGTVGKNKGRDSIVGTSTDFETENKNIQQQYLMAQAIEEISKLNIVSDIAIAEKSIFETEEIERMAAKNKKRKGLFSVHCKYCGVVITDGNLMRHVNKKWYIVCDKEVLTRVDRITIPTKKQKEFDGFRMLEKAYGSECGHNWDSIFMYKESEFIALAQDYVKIFDRQAGKFIDCRKWSNLVFKIKHMSDDDLQNYKK